MTREEFLNLNETIQSSDVIGNIIVFNNVNTIFIDDTCKTTIDNSKFFINGFHISNNHILSIENNLQNLNVTFDSGSIEFDINQTDFIIGIGKFNIL